MKNGPKVSVCIPTYNSAQFLGAAIQSVLDQTFPDFELVVCDDHSADDTQAVVAAFSDDRIRYHRNEANLGLVGNWNRCIELATGQYVYIFHADDVMLPENLSHKVLLLEENPRVSLVHSNIQTIDANGRTIGGHWADNPTHDLIEDGGSCFQRLALQGNFICCPTVMVRAECYQKLGGFNPRLHHTADMEMWMRIALHYDVAYVAAPSLLYRKHEKQDNVSFVGSEREMTEVLLALKTIFSENWGRIKNARTLYKDAVLFVSCWAFTAARSNARKGQLSRSIRYAILAARTYTLAFSPRP
jgi:glycosyltransferase involved in cell wall biosynthesis